MKFALHIWLAFFLLFPSMGKSESIDPIPLFSTSKYDPQKEEGRDFAEFTSSFGLSTIGQIYLSTSVDIEKDIYQKLSAKDLRPYFLEESERRMISRSISSEIHKRYLGGTLSNAKVTGAISFAATTLMNEIIERAMAAQGVTDRNRRVLWSQKILKPFHLCIKKTKTYSEANKCLDSLQKDAVKNVGLAVVYELARQETSPEVAAILPSRFHRCVDSQKSGADSRVMGCALEGARRGIISHGLSLVEKSAKANNIKNPQKIVKQVQGPFSACVTKSIDKKEFINCGNSLVADAGALMTEEAIRSHPDVKKYVKDAELDQLAKNGKSGFKLCIVEQSKKTNGIVDTGICAQQVKLDTIKKVSLLQLHQNIKEMKGIAPETQEAITAELDASLDKCWNSQDTVTKNGTCLRSNVISLASKLSILKLEEKLPEGLRTLKPSLKSSLVKTFTSCLNRELPQKLLEESGSEAKLAFCTGSIQREAAMEVASYSLRETLVGSVNDESLIRTLDQNLVKNKFSSCLGKTPNEEKVEACALQLKKDAGLDIGKLLLTNGYDSFVLKEGGMKALNLSPAERKEFLDSLLKEHQDCLAKGNLTNSNIFVDQCFKLSVRKMSQTLGNGKFQKSIRNLILPAQQKSITKLFLGEFDDCLQEKEDSKYSIKEYLTQVDACSLELSSKFTIEIARLRIHNSVQEHLPEERESDVVKEIKSDLLKGFAECMETPGRTPTQNRVECAKKMENEGVIRIVKEATRREVNALFSKGHPELQKIESSLDLCVKEETVMENCAMRHIMAAAKRFGSLKFNAQLEGALGKKDKEEVSDTIALVEKDYINCLDKIKKEKLSAEFLHEIKQCSSLLEKRGLEIVQNQFTKWMDRSMASVEKPDLSKKVALALPCFDRAFTFSPADAADSVDAEGILKELAKLIGGYIDYDLEKANDDFDAILAQLSADLAAAGPPEARKKLLQLLIDRGVADRLLRSIVAAQVREKLNSLPKEEQLPDEVKKLLTDRKLLEKSLGPEQMARLKPILVDRILTPLLLEGKSMKSKDTAMAASVIEREVADTLLTSPHFGDLLVDKAIQSNIDAQRGISDWVFENVFGYSYDWSKIKDSQEARDYVRDYLIAPRIRGETISEAELKKRKKKAEKLIIKAMKNQ